MKRQHRSLEDRIETAIRLPPAKGAIDAGVMDLPASLAVLFDGQFLPLASHVQQSQYVIEEGMQGQFGRRAAASHGQVRQDKFPEPLEAQFRRNPLRLLGFRHFGPQKSRTVDRLRRFHANSTIPEPCGRKRPARKPATSRGKLQRRGRRVSVVPGPMVGQWAIGGAQCHGINSSMRSCGQPFTRRVSSSVI